MHKHAVVGGIVAAVVLSCTGPGMEAAGRAMHDAGEAMAGIGGAIADAGRELGGRGGVGGSGGRAAAGGGGRASGGLGGTGGALRGAGGRMLSNVGGMLAVAGRAVSDAGGALASAGQSAGGSGASGAQAQEPNDGLPRAHWVLRDKDGTPVKADFYVYDEPKDFFADASVDCVSVQYFGNRYIAGQYYRLSDGAFGICYPNAIYRSQSWRLHPLAFFGPNDDACNGQALSTSRFGSLPIEVGGAYYYTDGAPSVTATTYYRWNQTSQKCELQTSATPTSLWAFKPVPADVLNLLNKPPYTVELVY